MICDKVYTNVKEESIHAYVEACNGDFSQLVRYIKNNSVPVLDFIKKIHFPEQSSIDLDSLNELIDYLGNYFIKPKGTQFNTLVRGTAWLSRLLSKVCNESTINEISHYAILSLFGRCLYGLAEKRLKSQRTKCAISGQIIDIPSDLYFNYLFNKIVDQPPFLNHFLVLGEIINNALLHQRLSLDSQMKAVRYIHRMYYFPSIIKYAKLILLDVEFTDEILCQYVSSQNVKGLSTDITLSECI
ncbi:hypothetical protein RF11_04827 [Thelohanellus kitauei]|uniref:Uncharacterized protein n=1 Tax=Thelohanellus kitauei TaxID=669202 RepID=A0A0C2J0U7_THEKT|nr:hypothetical protein RF11_04827 [Thelohanellus kitauei]